MWHCLVDGVVHRASTHRHHASMALEQEVGQKRQGSTSR